jgi:5-methylcytosine-specific restriction endonuclease McrA
VTKLDSTLHSICKSKAAASLSRAAYLAGARKPEHYFKCEHCGKDSYRKLSGTTGSPNRWCSMQCRKDASAARLLAIRAPPVSKICHVCATPFTATRHNKARCSRACDLAHGRARWLDVALSQHRAEARIIVCEGCQCQFSPLYGSSSATLCVPCAGDRARTHKQIHRLRRKALQRGATVEAVNPLKVFEHDGWRCKLCNGRTPKSKRGTQHDDAPELDHIIPLSKGGEHSYRNTQCACRKCNAEKSDKPMGQMLLIG